MGTLGILRALLVHIQGEANPLYRVERRWKTLLARGPGCILIMVLPFAVMLTLPVLLALTLPVLAYPRQFSGRVLYSGGVNGAVIFAICLLTSLAWTVLPAALAGQSISRERTAQTWDLLLTTPYPTATILLAKAAASTREIWGSVLGIASMMVMLRLALIVGVLTVVQTSLAVKVLLGLFCAAVTIAEPVQELALSLVVGLGAAVAADSSRLTSVYGALGGLLIRIAPIMILTLLLPPRPGTLVSISPTNAAIIGVPALLVATPIPATILLVIILIAAREGLIHVLFSWTIRRAHEG